jgi:1,3-beta-glucanosyltransferase GAS1
MASISPSSTNSASYTPSNSPQACPALASGVWEAKASPLPPSANPELCACMMASLSCVVKPDTSENDYGTLFNQVCGYGSSICAGFAANASSGTYGAYSVCNSTEQLSFAFNQYYLSQNKADSACNFGSAAQTQASASATGTCSALLNQAGTAGTGSVTSSPTAGPASSSSHKSTAGTVTIPRFDFGLLTLGLYVSLVAMVGAGMILM